MSINKLTGTLVYVQVDQPKPCYVAEKGSEWKASIVVDEDTADKWDEAFPKQTAKQVKTAEFEGIYKIAAPYPDQRKQYVITLRKNTKLGNGNDVPPQYTPKLFQQKGNSLVDVTHSVLAANGSIGQISVDVYEGKMGTFARLKNILVTELIEYVKPEGGAGSEPGSEFGVVSSKPESKPAPAPKQATPKSKPPVLVDESLDDDDPF